MCVLNIFCPQWPFVELGFSNFVPKVPRWKSKTQVTSSNPRVTSSKPRVTSSNSRVASSNPGVMSSNSEVTSSIL